MGMYLNPGNAAFREIADKDYVDKTGLIHLINETIGKRNKLSCVSWPRRFGKSWAANMLVAYYDCSCDSHDLFDHRAISRYKNYTARLNQFNVLHIDVSAFVSEIKSSNGSLMDVSDRIKHAVWRDLVEAGFEPQDGEPLTHFLLRCTEQPDGKRFIFIIDEWDSPIREAENDTAAQEAYLGFLRGWFKNSDFTPKAVAAAYMTGILPIKKDGSQSAISDFREYSVLDPGRFAQYLGFTESEVKRVCKKNKMPFEEVKTWYDGYRFAKDLAMYNPYSVMMAMETGACRSFWGKTAAAEGLTRYIKMDFDGLQETVASLIAGTAVPISIEGFQNELKNFGSRDDVLTLLTHFGYLTYDTEQKTVCIPNEELRQVFKNFLSNDNVGEQWGRLIARSNKILEDTIQGNEAAVASALEEIRGEEYAPQYYNNEQSLRAVIKYAYLSAIGKYVKVEEMPSGKGLADVVYIPASNVRLPALVVELKWDRTAGGAIEQIRKKQYTAALKVFEGNMILCGLTYNTKTGKHTCKIERA